MSPAPVSWRPPRAWINPRSGRPKASATATNLTASIDHSMIPALPGPWLPREGSWSRGLTKPRHELQLGPCSSNLHREIANSSSCGSSKD